MVTIGEPNTSTVVLTVAGLGEVVRGPASDHGVPRLLLAYQGSLTRQAPSHAVTVPAAVLSSSRLAVTEAVLRSGLVQPVSLLLSGGLWLISLLLVEAGVLSL